MASRFRLKCISARSLVTIILMAAIGCSSASDLSDSEGTTSADNSNGAKADFFGVADRLGPTPNFEGPYELSVVSTVLIRNKENPDAPPTKLLAGISGVANLTRTNDQVDVEFEPCQVTLPTIDRNEFSIPDESVRKLPKMVFAGSLTAGEKAYQLKTQTAAFIAGAELDAPLSESLPEDEDAPTVVDSEGDEYPGITVLVRGSYKIFAVVRVIFELDGELGTDQTWSGGADLNLDISVLGDKIPLHNAKRMIDEQLAEIQIADQTNVMQMTPIDASLGSCERLYP
ncbi:MAG: hypothetical protein VX589_13255 [Myxococcota bacterium]|nr:hypothetical protein [Myxococcota bacterium]